VPDVGVFDDGLEDEEFDVVGIGEAELGDAVVEEDGLGEAGAVELEDAGLVDGELADVWITGLGASLADLSVVLGFALVAGAAVVGCPHAGASSGMRGALAGAELGSSARRVPAAHVIRARASTTARAQRRARNARTVDASTEKKSIEVGPAFSDALRNNVAARQVHEAASRGEGKIGRGGKSAEAARGSAQRESVREFEKIRQEGSGRSGEGRTNSLRLETCQDDPSAEAALHKVPRTK
jgi:hypothetical protein